MMETMNVLFAYIYKRKEREIRTRLFENDKLTLVRYAELFRATDGKL